MEYYMDVSRDHRLLEMASSAGTVVEGILATLKAAYDKGEVPLKAIVAALLLYGIKEFLNDIVFSCPSDHYETYGLLFIAGPTVLLFCLSLMVSESFWHLITGCGFLSCGRRRLIWSKARNAIYVACMPPVIWLVYAFVEEDYYVCAKLGRLDDALSKANDTTTKQIVAKRFEATRTESQVIAWGLILGFTIVATLLVTMHRCFVRMDAKLRGAVSFDQLEADKAVELFNARIKPLAEAEAKKVVDNVFDLYKDKDSWDQIRLGEEYLRKLYPRHSGLVNGQLRVEHKSDVHRPRDDAEDEDGENIPLREVNT